MFLGKRTYTITALQRGLHLLQIFARAEKGLTPLQAAKLSSLPISTVHRFLVNLETAGFLHHAESGLYHLGISCIALAQTANGDKDVRRVSMPHLNDLNLRTRETVHLAVRHGHSAVFVEECASPETLCIHSRLGTVVPLHPSAAGKVFFAHLPEAERESLLQEMDGANFAENIYPNLDELPPQFRAIQSLGYAVDYGEDEIHVCSIAVPIWDASAAVCAALSLTAPAVRMSPARVRRIAPLLIDAARKISAELGYKVPAKLSVMRPSAPPQRPARRLAAVAGARH